MKDNPIFFAALLSLAVKACRSTPALDDAMNAYSRGDYTGAEAKLLAAALNENPEAQQLLGFMYAIGTAFYPGIKQNVEAASLWLERAARKGRPAARYVHGALERRGASEISADIVYCFDRLESMTSR